MNILWGKWLILLLGVIHCYDNICEKTSCRATQSSTFEDFSADKLIDGNMKQNFMSCSHTETARSVAWVMVDLRKEYQLKNIVIYYRTEASWKPFRFREYSLEVSNSSDAIQWIQCYKDSTDLSHIPPSIQNISCEKYARYLRIITTYDAPEDDPVVGAILEICEIQVYGCDSNHYGPNCSQECSVNCVNQTCDIATGFCTYGCKSGFYLEKCEQRCSASCPSTCNRKLGECEGSCPVGKYGNFCNTSCNQNCENGCNKNNGLCDSGCIVGKFGADCLLTCGDGCISGCLQADGNCTCKTGWQGDQCDGCDSNHYGSNCSQECSVNCISQACDNVTGFCTYGCESGFYSEKCEQRCSASCPSTCNRKSGECEGSCPVGKYGSFCNTDCNQNCENGCNKNNGVCDSGCILGKFGTDCLRTCGDGCISGCLQADGNCTCKTGWQGHYCDECSQTHFGAECDQLCSPRCLNGTCFPNNGSCKDGFNSKFNDDTPIQVISSESETCSSSNVYSALYGVITILIMSIFLNILLIVRNVRQTIPKRQNSGKINSPQNSIRDANTTNNDSVEDNAGYQELGRLSQPSHNDRVEDNAGYMYQELGELSQPSHYEKLK